MAAAGALTLVHAKMCLGELDVDELERAMRQARATGIMGWSFCGQRVVSRLVKAAFAHEIELEHAVRLLRAYEIAPDDDAVLLERWPWPIRIRVLGPVEIDVDGARVEFGRKLPTVPLALLKLLAATPRPLAASKVTAALWPGMAADASRGPLDTAVYRLRKILGSEDAIVHRGGAISLNPTRCWTDVRAFELVCTRIEEHPTPSAIAQRSDPLTKALTDLYRGPLATEGIRVRCSAWRRVSSKAAPKRAPCSTGPPFRYEGPLARGVRSASARAPPRAATSWVRLRLVPKVPRQRVRLLVPGIPVERARGDGDCLRTCKGATFDRLAPHIHVLVEPIDGVDVTPP